MTEMGGGMMGESEFFKVLFCSKCKRSLCNERLHRHRGWSLFYNISGSAHVVVLRNRQERVVELHSGEFVFLSSMVPHRMRIGNDNSYIVHLMLYPCDAANAALSIAQLKGVSEEACGMMCQPSLFVHAVDMNNMLMNTLTEVLLNYDFCQKESGLSAVPGLMLETMLIEIAYLYRQKLEPRADRYVNQAVTYMKQHCADVIRVADLAGEVGVHPAYLQRIFKERMGVSMMEYLVQYRIRRARRLLLNTGYPIIDIACECGFSNRQHFSRCFRKIVGMAPSEYRQRNKIISEDTIFAGTEEEKPGDMMEL